jgi:hypothetical protein
MRCRIPVDGFYEWTKSLAIAARMIHNPVFMWDTRKPIELCHPKLLAPGARLPPLESSIDSNAFFCQKRTERLAI